MKTGLEIGARLPELAIRTGPRNALVLLLVPDAGEAWADYVADVAASARDIEEWYAEIVVLAGGSDAAAARLKGVAGDRLALRSDADGAAAAALDADRDAGMLVVADRYGQVYHVERGSTPEAMSDAAEIEQWTRFLATQCPECGVIDEPGHGEWSR